MTFRRVDMGRISAGTTSFPVSTIIRAMAAGLLLLTSFPSRANALCANCLGQTRTLTLTLEWLGAFLLVPFAVAYVVYRVIRNACRDQR
jgi:hypothetical protein